jgi:hypothetical protein
VLWRHHASECDVEYCHDCGQVTDGGCDCEDSEVELGEDVYGAMTSDLQDEGSDINAILKRDGAVAAMAAHIKAHPGTFDCWLPYVQRYNDRKRTKGK